MSKWLNTVGNIISPIAALATKLCQHSLKIPNLSIHRSSVKWEENRNVRLYYSSSSLSQTISANQLDFNCEVKSQKNLKSLPGNLDGRLVSFGGKGPKILNQCSVSFALQFKPRHTNTYIGQIYKSGFSSLLMLLAAKSLFGASSKTGFIPLGFFLLFVIWWSQFQIILCDFHTPYYKEESHQILADNVQFASWLK